MKVVIDTNVVVSAILRDRLPEAVIRFVLDHSELVWVATDEILSEYFDVLARPKFSLPAEILDQWTALLRSRIAMVGVVPPVDFPRDPADAKFLACAMAVEAEYLISGDRDLTSACKVGSTTIITATLFKTLICDTWPDGTGSHTTGPSTD